MSESDDEDGAGAAEAAAQAAAVAAAQADGANVVVESASRPSAGAARFRRGVQAHVLALRRLRACARGVNLAMCATARPPAPSRSLPPSSAARHARQLAGTRAKPRSVQDGSRDSLCQRAGLTRGGSAPARRAGRRGCGRRRAMGQQVLRVRAAAGGGAGSGATQGTPPTGRAAAARAAAAAWRAGRARGSQGAQG